MSPRPRRNLRTQVSRTRETSRSPPVQGRETRAQHRPSLGRFGALQRPAPRRGRLRQSARTAKHGRAAWHARPGCRLDRWPPPPVTSEALSSNARHAPAPSRPENECPSGDSTRSSSRFWSWPPSRPSPAALSSAREAHSRRVSVPNQQVEPAVAVEVGDADGLKTSWFIASGFLPEG